MKRALRHFAWSFVFPLSLHAQTFNALCVHKGHLYAGGEESGPTPYLAERADGWRSMALPKDLPKQCAISALAWGTEGLYMAWKVTGKDLCGVQLWDGTAWNALPKTPKDWRSVESMAPDAAGGLYLHVMINGWNQLGLWDGKAWSTLPAPADASYGRVGPLVAADGVLWTTCDGANGGIYHRSGDSWVAAGTTMKDPHYMGLVQLPDGRIVRGRDTALEQWHGSAWSAVPGWDANSWRITALAASPDGALYIGQMGASRTEHVLACLQDGGMRYQQGRFRSVVSMNAFNLLTCGSDGRVFYGFNNTLFRDLPPEAFTAPVVEIVVEEAPPAAYPEQDEKAAEVLALIRAFVPEVNAVIERSADFLVANKERLSHGSAKAVVDHVEQEVYPLMRGQDERMKALGVAPRRNRLLDAWQRRQEAWSRLNAADIDIANITLYGASDALIETRVEMQKEAADALDKCNKALNDMLPEYKKRNGL